jgi:hypothetical protein
VSLYNGYITGSLGIYEIYYGLSFGTDILK